MTHKKTALIEPSYVLTQNKTKQVILAALFAALAYVSIQSLHVSIFAPIGAPFFHVGNAMVALAALYLGIGYGTFAGAIGLAMFDVMNGYAVEMPIVFIGNVLVALAIQLVYRQFYPRFSDKLWIITLAVSSGVVVKLLTDFIKGLIRALVTGVSFQPTIAISFTSLLATAVNGIGTIILVVLLYAPVKRILVKLIK
ncbi:ECF transporter S component [Lactococcus carnosus]|uniref:ECF transporter S component n=1 Tax=Pseudolactococcus carnosus TaxID=2749961 RepID=A0ABT0AVF2_9LACT|nr:ECF transporter S component [Lactococcus carnosus]MCJ1990579.1 ECF transporter S component [Lactococcus carnosus]